MARDIYDEFDAATRGIEAWVILKDGALIGKVVKKISKSGLQVTAYVHIHGAPMTKGIARGGGYDRMSAAVENALKKPIEDDPSWISPSAEAQREDFAAALNSGSDGAYWYSRVADAGYQVKQLF